MRVIVCITLHPVSNSAPSTCAFDICFWSSVVKVHVCPTSLCLHFYTLMPNTFDMFYQSDFASTLFFFHAVLGSRDTTKLNKAHNENKQCGAKKIGEFGGGGEVEKNRRELWALCQQEAHAALRQRGSGGTPGRAWWHWQSWALETRDSSGCKSDAIKTVRAADKVVLF